MKEFVTKVLVFFRDDFFPNLPYYLLQIFLIVVLVLIFAGINIAVRMITDPICHKVLRMREDKRWPGLIGLVIAAVITALLLAWSYTVFPQLRPTVIGWTGHKVQQLLNWGDRLPDLEPVPIELPPKPTPSAAPPSALAPTPIPAPAPVPAEIAPGEADGPP